MFFGSALTNFGIRPFLHSFLHMARPPQARPSSTGPVDPVRPFSGFVFKIMANMDPDHRDRVAFVRVCSGRFEKGSQTTHVPTGKKIRLSNSTLLMAQDRQQVEEAYPGDVIGLFDPGVFRIGDTLSDEGGFEYDGIPSFSPEHFAQVAVAEVLRRKALEKGLDQLTQEGLVQLFRAPGAGSAAPILGAVGPLQFEVLKYRMEAEYNVDLRLEPLAYSVCRWPVEGFEPSDFEFSVSTRLVEDRHGHPVLLIDKPWSLDWLQRKHPGLVLRETAPR
jgi:peptide chain release factor 3